MALQMNDQAVMQHSFGEIEDLFFDETVPVLLVLPSSFVKLQG